MYAAVHATSATRTYTITADEPALTGTLTGYGSMEGPTTGDNKGTLTINGGGYSILGGGKTGITVGSDQTLTINNVNGANSTGDNANKGRTGFSINGDGGVLYISNGGSVGITCSTFTGNSSRNGGAIINSGTIITLGTSTDKVIFGTSTAGTGTRYTIRWCVV